MATCNDCIHRTVCVILAVPDAFENTKWDKEPCDHFKAADVAPRAEVAREIFEEIDKFLKEKHQAVDDIWCDIEDDDEVLNAFYMAKTESYFVVKNFVDELKKKYTEEN